MMSEILLKPTVIIHNEKYIDKATRILKKAEDACLIAHSIKSKIIMEVNIQVIPLLIESESNSHIGNTENAIADAKLFI